MTDESKRAAVAERTASLRAYWSSFAERYTDKFNTRLTIQCASQMHAAMDLENASSVLEVASGAGLGSQDILQYLKRGAQRDGKQRQLIATDLAPTMVELASKNLLDANSELVTVQVMEANGQDLVQVPSASVNRYVSSLCLQLCPDPDALLKEAKRVLTSDGIAGFTIWARPECSGLFTIDAQLNLNRGVGDGNPHPNFALGSDLMALRQRFAAAGFSKVMIWPYLCAVELWTGEAFARKYLDMFSTVGHDNFPELQRLGDEWLANKGLPIGLETYIVIARA